MSGKNKTHNSIIFLTTLSVYLSLSLLGAAPQVLAYAATTRDFDIQTEIEYRDDFDNKPDSEEIDNSPAANFPVLFADLLTEIRQNIETGKIASPLQTDFRFEAYFNYSEMCSGSGFGSDPSADKYLAKIVSDNFRQKFAPQVSEAADYPRPSAKTAKINLQTTAAAWELKISFGKSNVEQFAAFLNRKFAASARSTENKTLKPIYENTKATFENNQIFIITNLPRAAIDSSIQ